MALAAEPVPAAAQTEQTAGRSAACEVRRAGMHFALQTYMLTRRLVNGDAVVAFPRLQLKHD